MHGRFRGFVGKTLGMGIPRGFPLVFPWVWDGYGAALNISRLQTRSGGNDDVGAAVFASGGAHAAGDRSSDGGPVPSRTVRSAVPRPGRSGPRRPGRRRRRPGTAVSCDAAAADRGPSRGGAVAAAADATSSTG